MSRRIAVTMLAMVAAALAVAGAGSHLLTRRATLEDARSEVALQARQFAAANEDVRRPATLAVVRQALRLRGATVVRFSTSGRALTALPTGITPADLRPTDLAAGATVSGTRRTLVYAASPVRSQSARAGAVVAVVFTRELKSLNRGIGFFLLAAVVSLGLAGVVGRQLGDRIAAPLERAEAATRRMAAGDLTARIEFPAETDPELRSLAASIGSLATSLERSRAAERDFLLAVSHDLRTPLTSIRGYGEAIADGALDDTAHAGSIITGEARRLERLVGDLLELGRIGAGTFGLTLSEVRVDDVVAATADALQLVATDAGLTLTGPGPNDAVVTADPDRLAQIVANLVENALRFAATRVELAIVTAPGLAGFNVDDDGPGIAVAEQRAVFTRHYRSDTVRGRHIGTGLGLAIVAELVAAMQGTVTVASPPPGYRSGTRVSVLFPANAGSTSGPP